METEIPFRGFSIISLQSNGLAHEDAGEKVKWRISVDRTTFISWSAYF